MNAPGWPFSRQPCGLVRPQVGLRGTKRTVSKVCLCLVLSVWLGTAPAAPQTTSGMPQPSAGEGPLSNDTSLATDSAATAEFARGDERSAKLDRSITDTAQIEREWAEVFDAWRSAVLSGGTDSSVPVFSGATNADGNSRWIDPEGTASAASLRRTEGLEVALLRRLHGLPPPIRKAWRARFELAGQDALRQAGRDPALLASLERTLPATPAALSAAANLADLALEAGHQHFAHTWIERARVHAQLLDQDASTWSLALDQRARWLEEHSPAPDQGVWQTAQGLSLEREIGLVDLSQLARAQRPLVGRGPQSGGAWLADGTLVIQSTQFAGTGERARGDDWISRMDLSSNKITWSSSLREIAQSLELSLASNTVPREHPGWPHRPCTDGQRVILVCNTRPAALVCLDFGASKDPSDPPRLSWAWISPGDEQAVQRAVPGERPEPIGAQSCDAGARFEPGPVWIDSVLLVQTRQAEESTGGSRQAGVLRAALVGIDAATGWPLFKRTLARGSEVAREGTRFAGVSASQSTGQPLAANRGATLAATNLGTAAVFDACDGRQAYALKTRRKARETRGFAGTLAAATLAQHAGFLHAPADSDRMYFLRADQDLGSFSAPDGPAKLDGLFLSAPLPIEQAEALMGGDLAGALLLSRAGRSRTLAQWDPATGARLEAVYAGLGESFTGSGLLSAQRAYYTTDRGLWLVDRTRELFLLDFEAVPTDLPFGGDIAARDDRVLVLGPHAVWVFRAR